MPARRINGDWFVDFRFEGERIRKRAPVNTKRGAEEYEHVLRQEKLALRLSGKEEIKPPIVKEFAQDFLTTYAKPKNKPSEVASKETILRLHLVPAMGGLTLDKIDGLAIDKYKAEKMAEKRDRDGKLVKKGLTPKTINNHLTVLHKMLAVAVKWKRLAHLPPIEWLKVPEQEFDFLTFEEGARLLLAARGMDGEWGAMITVAIKTGLRLGELLAVRWEDVDLVAGRLVVRRAVARGIVGTPKGGRSREVELSPEAVATLKGHRHLRGDLVFSDGDGAMLVKTACKWPLWRACKKAGLRRIGWHVLRHTFASHLVMRGVHLKAVQELLGHTSMKTTMRYAHLSPDVRRDAVALLDRPAPVAQGVGN